MPPTSVSLPSSCHWPLSSPSVATRISEFLHTYTLVLSGSPFLNFWTVGTCVLWLLWQTGRI